MIFFLNSFFLVFLVHLQGPINFFLCFYGNGDTIRIDREIQCLLYVGFKKRKKVDCLSLVLFYMWVEYELKWTYSRAKNSSTHPFRLSFSQITTFSNLQDIFFWFYRIVLKTYLFLENSNKIRETHFSQGPQM